MFGELSEKQKALSKKSFGLGKSLFDIESVNRWKEEHGLPLETSLSISRFLIDNTNLLAPDYSENQYFDAVLVVEQFVRAAGTALPLTTDLMGIQCLKILGAQQGVQDYIKYYTEKGRFLFAFCSTEPKAGSDLAPGNLCTSVRREDGVPYLSGHKVFVNNGEFCPSFLVLAKDLDASNQKIKHSSSLWLVPNGVRGVKAVPIRKNGQGILPFADVTFEDVPLSEEDNLLKASETASSKMTQIYCVDRLFGCAACLGMAQAAMDAATSHISNRTAFGHSVSEFQLVQEMIVRMQVNIDNMRNLVYRAASDMDNEGDYRNSTTLAKWYVPRTAVEVASDAVQLFGATGYTSAEQVYGIWEDCRGYQIASGTDQIMVTIAAPGILSRYSEQEQ